MKLLLKNLLIILTICFTGVTSAQDTKAIKEYIKQHSTLYKFSSKLRFNIPKGKVFVRSENWCAPRVTLRIETKKINSILSSTTLKPHSFPNAYRERGKRNLAAIIQLLLAECKKAKEFVVVATKEDPRVYSFNRPQIALFAGKASKATFWQVVEAPNIYKSPEKHWENALKSDFRPTTIFPDENRNWCGKEEIFNSYQSDNVMLPTQETYMVALQYFRYLRSVNFQYLEERRKELQNLRKRFSRKVRGKGKFEKKRIKETKIWLDSMKHVEDLALEESRLIWADYQIVLTTLLREMNFTVDRIDATNILQEVENSRHVLNRIKKCLYINVKSNADKPFLVNHLSFLENEYNAFDGVEGRLFSTISKHVEKDFDQFSETLASHLYDQITDVEADAAWYSMHKVLGDILIRSSVETAYTRQKRAIKEKEIQVANRNRMEAERYIVDADIVATLKERHIHSVNGVDHSVYQALEELTGIKPYLWKSLASTLDEEKAYERYNKACPKKERIFWPCRYLKADFRARDELFKQIDLVNIVMHSTPHVPLGMIYLSRNQNYSDRTKSICAEVKYQQICNLLRSGNKYQSNFFKAYDLLFAGREKIQKVNVSVLTSELYELGGFPGWGKASQGSFSVGRNSIASNGARVQTILRCDHGGSPALPGDTVEFQVTVEGGNWLKSGARINARIPMDVYTALGQRTLYGKLVRGDSYYTGNSLVFDFIEARDRNERDALVNKGIKYYIDDIKENELFNVSLTAYFNDQPVSVDLGDLNKEGGLATFIKACGYRID